MNTEGLKKTTNLKQLGKTLVLTGMLLLCGITAKAADYVFMYNNYFLGSNTTTPTTSFIPNNSIYSGTSGGTFVNAAGYYIRYNNGLQFSTTNSSNLYIYNNYLVYPRYPDYGEQYIQYNYALNMNNPNNNNRAWRMSDNGNQATAYTVTTEVIKMLSDFTISGNDILTSATTYPYTHTNSYLTNYTKYSWTDHTYYSTNPAQAASTTAPAATEVTTGYTWTLEGGGTNASVNASSGQITVSSLPATDLIMTLTCSVTNNGVTKTASKTVVLQGTTIAAPTITNSNNNISLSTASVGATIYYTTDGTEPSASNGATYTVPFNTESLPFPLTIKAIATRGGNSSIVSTQTYSQPKCVTPEISISSTGAVSITCATTGATIRYTTGTTMPADPTESSTAGTSTTLTNLQYIKAKAFKEGYEASEVASGQYITSGTTTDGKVILNDREDHSWSYYSDPECPVRSLSPADVKITYYGDGIIMTGDADYTASSTAFIQPGNTNYVGGAKVNVGGENENTFVYYKTLERGADTQTAWTFSAGSQSSAASRCPYTPIPNPFQVRPTYGGTATTNTADWSGWRGFQCWRLKSVSGGSVYSVATGGTALATGAIINGETDIYFAPNSEYGMEVELEAVWARAYVVKASNGGANAIGDHSSLGYERNFIVLNTTSSSYNFGGTSGKRITNIDRQVTVSNYLPNGVRGQNNDATYIRGAANSYNLTLETNTKFENVAFNMANNTLTAANNNLIIGRGCSGTINYVSGVNANVTSPSYTIRLESGTINYLSFLRGYSTTDGTATDVPGNYQTYTVGGTPNVKGVLGCDYDRATNSGITNNLIVNNGAFFGYSVSEATGIVYSEKAFTVYLKSGKIGNSFTINNSYTADADEAFYIGIAGQRVRGHRTLYMEGGEIASIAGGIDATQNQDYNSVTVRMTGGHVRGAVYGGAARSAAYGNRNMIVTGGSITGWIGGGCNGEAYPAGQTSEDTYGGITNGAAKVYFGGTATCGGTGSDVNINGSQGGIVFGAGKGVEGNTTSGRMAQGTTVVVADACDIERNVYGGGNFGYAQTSTNVYVSGGTVHGKVFGGSNQNNGPVINITMTGGTIEGGLYGGSNTTGTINNNVTMEINGGQVGTPSTPANIHGGGYGQPTRVSQNVEITLGASSQTTPGVTVYGDVYGGSALGHVNGEAATSTYHTYVTMYKGTINGSLYGGALGDLASLGTGHSNVAANVYGPVKVEVRGGSVRKTDANGANGSGGVYGANNINGAPQREVTVDIYATDPAPSANEYALYAVYGGGNHADYTYGNGYPQVAVRDCENSIEYVYGGGNAADVASTDVKIYGGNVIGNVFGGGNGTVTAANVTGNAKTEIYGGTILRVFGGSNSQGTIGGTISVTVEKDAGANCPMHLGEIYGGGNMAASQAGSITIGCTGSASNNEAIDYVYGGANQANVTGDIELNITGGRINNVYGGNNTSGSIDGTIKVNVDWANSSCDNYLGNVFGGGNLAEYSAPSGYPNYPEVNIKDGVVNGSVFGGGNGDPNSSTQTPGQVFGNPQVTIGDIDDARHAVVKGNVYGGGNAAKVTGNTFILLRNRAKVYGNIYGGGNMGPVDGNTNVIVNGKKL